MGETLLEALGLAEGQVVALVGGGGKTTALYRLLREAAAPGSGRAIGTTTTRMWPPAAGEVDALVEEADVERALAALDALPEAARRVLVAGPRAADGKLSGIPPAAVTRLAAGRRLTVVEADGSAGRPVKGAAPHEPALPPRLDLLVPVAGADAVGAPFGPDVVHRPEVFAAQAGLSLTPGDPIPAEAIAAVLLHPRGALRRLPPEARAVPLLTRLGGTRHRAGAEALAAALLARGARRVVVGDLGGPLTVHEAPPARVAAVLLAAGRGERMGAGPPKPLRRLAGRPLLEHVAAAALASGVAEVVVVLGHAAQALRPVLERLASPRLRAVENPRHAEGQGTSVAAGTAALPAGVTGALFLLVDQPLVRAPLVDRLLARHLARPDRILVPACDGRRGNPVLFPADLLPALAALSGDRGGRAVLDRAPARVEIVETGDPAVVTDVDTPEALAEVEARLAGGG